jgi:hypothetical protein
MPFMPAGLAHKATKGGLQAAARLSFFQYIIFGAAFFLAVKKVRGAIGRCPLPIFCIFNFGAAFFLAGKKVRGATGRCPLPIFCIFNFGAAFFRKEKRCA